MVPILRCFNYCATKAALHAFILVLREQLRGSKIKVVEIFPPAVQSMSLPKPPSTISGLWLNEHRAAELHDTDKQPDFENGRSFGMPLDQFTNEAYEGLAAGEEDVVVGTSKGWYDAFETKRQEQFQNVVKRIRASK